MSTDPHRRLRSYVAALDVPPPADDVTAIIARATARRASVRRWRAPLVAAAVVILLLLLVPVPELWTDRPHRPAATPATPTLPDRIARYSYLTGAVSQAPPGRAIALYTQGMGVEFMDFPQALVLSADGDVYRQVDLAGRRAGARSQGDPAPMLLSPDGRRVAVGSIADAGNLAVLDLETADVTTRPARRDANIVPLAWSPDGRYVAALEIVGDPGAFSGRHMQGPLVLFDVDGTGGPRRFTGFGTTYRAAFSPDGTEIAVQGGGLAIRVVDLAGRTVRSLTPTDGLVLASNTAWSPDGTLLAVMGPSTVRFIDPSGGDRAVPAPVDVSDSSSVPVAWTGPDRLLLRVKGRHGDTDNVLVEVTLTTGARRKVTWVDTDPGGNYKVGDFQLATGLLAQVEARPAGPPDRGPWPRWLRGVVLIGSVAMVWLLVKAVRRRRRNGWRVLRRR